MIHRGRWRGAEGRGGPSNRRDGSYLIDSTVSESERAELQLR